MSVVAVDFSQSKTADEERRIRRVIRKAKDLSRSERDVLLCLANLWFYHRSGPSAEMHPGCDRIAKRAKVSVITVKRALKLFRERRVIIALAYLEGGRKATRYTMDLAKLIEWLDPSNVKVAPGEIVNFPQPTRSNDTVSTVENDTVYGYQNDTRYIRGVSKDFSSPEIDGGDHA